MSNDDRIEAAFLAAGIDPEFSAVIHEYHKNVYVYALVHTLANYVEHAKELDHLTKENRRMSWLLQMALDPSNEGYTLWDTYHEMDEDFWGRMGLE